MNYQNQVYLTAQSSTVLKVRQQLCRRKAIELPGGNALWLGVAKAACVILMMVLCVSFCLSSAAKKMEISIQNIEAQQYTIRNQQMTLLAQRAQLMSEQYVRQQARVELALVVPNDKQVRAIR